MHPLFNVPLRKAFPCLGLFCCCCGGDERRRKRVEEYAKLMIEERAEMEDNMQRMMQKTGAVFEGTGEETSSSVRNENAIKEEDHPAYDPYGQLGYGF